MPWFRRLDMDEDSLELRTGELEELENDEISLREAAFMRNYEDDSEAGYYADDEDEWV